MPRTLTFYTYLVLALAIPPQLAAQIDEVIEPRSIEKCRDISKLGGKNYDANGNPVRRGSRYCEVRDVTIPRRSLLVVEGGMNGDVTIRGWPARHFLYTP